HPQYGQDGAEAIAQLFEARIKAFAKYSGINPDEYIKAKNFQITYDDDSSGLNSDKRGRTEFIPERRDAQGNIISEAQTIIKIFKDADRSTILHELGHVFLKDLRDAFSAGNLKGVAKQDWGTLTKWLGVGDIDFNRGLSEQDRQRWTNAHEKFATGFEKYLMSGQAPTTKLKHAFEAFKRWLTNIYHSVRNITYTGTDGQQHSFTLSNEVKQIMDRMLDENANSDNQDNNNQEQLNFDRNNRTEGYNQIIGEQGAYRLDEQEGVTTRMDNLDVAKNMLDAGKDAKTIWLATGWEKGTEGKWRYEIPYGNFTDNFNKRKNIAMSLFDENLHIQGMNDSQRLRATRFIQLRKIFNAPELFKAYPNLEKLSVTLSQLPNNEKGNYKHSLNLITLDVVSENISPDSLRTTMIHERQHAIQYIEGFVTGDNPNKHTNEVDDYQTKREALFDNMQQILDDAEITTPEIFDSLKKHYNGDISELSQEEFNKKFEQTAKSLLDEKLGSEKAAEYEKLSHDYLNLIHNW
ncbi:MAG: hypothetical protein IJQ56_05570, partial [Synergistaceae bacterium]|nr:hypothetical protein [Synergistaceae bacterium]